MIWRDIVVKERLPDDAVAHALAAAFGDQCGPVVVSSDIDELGDQGVFALKTSAPGDAFSLTLSIYTALPVSDSTSMLRAIARQMGSSILTSDDESADPYSMQLFDQQGTQRQVRMAEDALDERGEYVFQDSKSEPVGPVRGVQPSVPAGERCPETGYWFTPAMKGSRRHFTEGQPMPSVLTEYGSTLWQWDEDQAP